MESKNYLDDLHEIKNLMNKSSRFISLSGLSGILAGVYSLIGAYFAHKIITDIQNTSTYSQRLFLSIGAPEQLMVIALIVMIASIVTGIVLTRKKSKKSGEKIWNRTSKRLLFNFMVPLITGGLFCFILLQNQTMGLIAPATLIFYGLACLNASKYTLGDVRYLGLANITIGLIATQYIGYGLYFWALGFGFLHILYGIVMYYKYDRH
ncbi:hypothetical protein [Cellulophaga baltica]|uniref:Brp/Blh family beta-carotene 15,15'-monooxygenase n=1 Tax=Cellulophaga baltica TaxID=76594 RepID=A0A1G7EAE3_9FLAO|nr:hypothetical protein [Cellulophaga baltica]SDE60560.1 hypothetical protein SAMN04487992_102196 [Cellulophaga baltica]